MDKSIDLKIESRKLSFLFLDHFHWQRSLYRENNKLKEKKVNDKNTPQVSLPVAGMETIQGRMAMLIGGRSLRQAAKDWELPYSTLNNYFEKGTMPGLNVVDKVSKIENVTLEWLIRGSNEGQQAPQKADEQNESLKAVSAILSSLENEELENIRKTLTRKGAEFVLHLTDKDSQEILTLCNEIKEIALLLKSVPAPRLREIFDSFAGNERAAPPTEESVKKTG